MDALPRELYIEIFSHLPQIDLFSVSKTCRSFAHLVKPHLFATLSFNGSDKDELGVHHHSTRTVDIANMDSAVEEVIKLGIAPLVKVFKFSPAWYYEDFWRKYRNWVVEAIDRELDREDFESIDDEDDDDDSEERAEDDDFDGWRVRRVNRIFARRESRLDRERELIEAGEKLWASRLEVEEEKEGIAKEALSKLFREMVNLKRVEIDTFALDMEELGFVDGHDYVAEEVLFQFSQEEQILLNFNFVASALSSAGRRISELHLPSLDPRKVVDSHDTRHAFAALTDLSIQFPTAEFFFKDAKMKSPLASLMQCARPTLKRLQLKFSESYLPDRGEHTLDKLWCTSLDSDDDADATENSIFPQLRSLELSTLIVSCPDLAKFLSVQPVLETVRFEDIYLGTKNYGWEAMAQSFPASLKTWEVEDCSVAPTGDFVDLIAYNWLPKFHPYRNPLPLSSGWKAKEPAGELNDDTTKARLEGAVYARVQETDEEPVPAVERPLFGYTNMGGGEGQSPHALAGFVAQLQQHEAANAHRLLFRPTSED